MREQLLLSALSDLNSTSTDISASAGISTDGLPIATFVPNLSRMPTVSARCRPLCWRLGNRAVQELACGELDQVMVKGKSGYILLSQAGSNAVLALLAKEGGKLG